MPRRTTGDPKTSNARINRQTIRLYWQQIRRYKISFFAMLVCIPLSSLLLDTVLPYVLSQAVDTFTSRDAETLWQLLGLAGIVAGVPCRAMVAGMPQNNRRPVGERGLLHQAGQRLAQRGQIRLL